MHLPKVRPWAQPSKERRKNPGICKEERRQLYGRARDSKEERRLRPIGRGGLFYYNNQYATGALQGGARVLTLIRD